MKRRIVERFEKVRLLSSFRFVYYDRRIIIITIYIRFEGSKGEIYYSCLSAGILLFIAMTLVSSQIFAALYGLFFTFWYLSRLMDDGKTSKCYRMEKRPSSGKPHQSNALEFLLRYFEATIQTHCRVIDNNSRFLIFFQ